jgi:bacterioferritin-associated ferredoxin
MGLRDLGADRKKRRKAFVYRRADARELFQVLRRWREVVPREGLDLITAFIIFRAARGTRMYVCICRAVTEEKVRDAIDAGAEDVKAVTAACCAGGDCGACHNVIEDMIDDRKRLSVIRAA